MTNVLIVRKEPPITWLQLNRPQVLNSLNSELLRAILNACDELVHDRTTRVVIIVGSGRKAFCAGADLTERKNMTEGEVIDYLQLIQKVMVTIENLPQLVLAAINGSAFGGGFELALACDLRIMSENSVLRLTEVKLGIIPGAGGTQRLSRLIGKSRAKEIILTARGISAAEAYHIGLIHKITPLADSDKSDDSENHQVLLNQAKCWAQEIATGAPLALQQAKYAIDTGYDRDLASGLAIETKSYLQLLTTKDRLEGLASFAEKRTPVYKGE